jgi:hypothetical protein
MPKNLENEPEEEILDGDEEVNDVSEEFDTDAALADISSELFGQDKGDEEEVETPSEEPEEAPDTSTSDEAPPAQPEENSVEVQEVGAPSTWSKEAIEEWAMIPPKSKAEILKREEDMFRGLGEYKEAAEVGRSYTKAIEPYSAVLASENVNPVELFGNFAGNHYLLSRGTPEQKLSVAANLISHYGINPNDIVARLEQGSQPNPEIQALTKEIQELKQGYTSIAQRETEATRQTLSQQIDEFAADPAHPYFDEVGENIAHLLKTGVATSLQDAYDKAVYTNPVTRQKEIDRLTAEKLTESQAAEKARIHKVAKSTAANVSSRSKPANGTVAVGSLDDTLTETMAQISARG